MYAVASGRSKNLATHWPAFEILLTPRLDGIEPSYSQALEKPARWWGLNASLVTLKNLKFAMTDVRVFESRQEELFGLILFRSSFCSREW